jgi:hypothetical protein
VKVDFRIKWDPRADGRVAQPLDLVEAWVQWDCPLSPTGPFTIKRGRIAANGVDLEYSTTVRTDWQQVVTYFANQGVVLPSQPSCPGY